MEMGQTDTSSVHMHFEHRFLASSGTWDVGGTWTAFCSRAALATLNNGLSTNQFVLAKNSAGTVYDASCSNIIGSDVAVNGGFETATVDSWGRTGPTTNWALQTAQAYSGAWGLYTNKNTSATSSVYNDRAITVREGERYRATIRLRASGSHTFSGTFAIWFLGPGGNNVATQNFSVGSSWTTVSVSLTAPVWADVIRGEVYLTTNGLNLTVDALVVQEAY